MGASTLFSAVYSLLTNKNPGQVSATPPTAATQTRVPTTTPQTKTTTTSQTLPQIAIPTAIQQQFINLASTSLTEALTAKQPAVGKTIDVATALFRSGVTSDVFTRLQPQVVNIAIPNGMSVAAANQATNAAIQTVTTTLPQVVLGTQQTLGTTVLNLTEFTSFITNAQQAFRTNVGALVGSTSTDPLTSALTTAKRLFDVDSSQFSQVAYDAALSATQYESNYFNPVTSTGAGAGGLQTLDGGDNAAGSSGQRKIYLRSAIDFNQQDVVNFYSQPTIEVEERAEYDITNPVHSVTGFASYKHTNLREISVSDIKLVSRTPEEATRNQKDLQTLKSWARPYFGKSSPVGAPPDILFLYAYSDANDPVNFYRFPVVLTSISYKYPNDVDYISTLGNTPFPVIMTVSIRLLETRSPTEVESFTLADFKSGAMLSW